MKSRYALGRGRNLCTLCLLLPICLILTACTPKEFDYTAVQFMLENSKLPLDGEQVMMNDSQVQCGVQAELWDVTPLGPTRFVGRLSPEARNVGFSDDIVMGEPGMQRPYVQIRGTFQLRVRDVGPPRDDGGKFKLVDVKVGVEIPHRCFADQLPELMAVRRGRFTQDAIPTFRFRNDSDWAFDRVQH